MKRLIWTSKLLIALFIVFLFVMSIGYIIGIRINTTPSIPLGIYMIIDKSPEKGDFIMFCPPDKPIFREARKRGWINKGFCEGEFGVMMKVLVAKAGDVVSINEYGVIINDILYDNSKPIMALNLSPFYLSNYTLQEREILTMTDHNPLSFDARYYGVLNKQYIRGVIKPIFTW